MATSLATISALTKELYQGPLQEQLNQEVIGLRRIERTSAGVVSEVGGKYVTFPVHTRRNAGIGARNEMEALPTAGQQSAASARVGLKYLYGSVQLSGQTMALADSNAQAFISALDFEINGLKDDLAVDLNRQVYGTPLGAVATVTAGYTGVNVVTVAHTIWAQLGMQIDLTDATGTVITSNRTITGITTTTITFNGAVATGLTGYLVTRTGNANREWSGLGSIITDTGSLYNIDPATEPVWSATVKANGGTNRALSEGLMIDCVHGPRVFGNSVTVGLTNLGVYRAYYNLLVTQRRFTNTKEFTGGFSGLAFVTDKGDIPIVVDTAAPPNTILFPSENKIKIYREGDWSFMQRDGSMWERVSGYDAYSAIMYQYSELGTQRRNAHAVLKDITEA
jgi:hypothetical protein